MEINLLEKYPKSKRNIEKRNLEKNDEVRNIARKFGKEFFDGDRKYGYGGFSYNPKYWSEVVATFKDYWKIKPGDKILDVVALAMSATLLWLMQLHVRPVRPRMWLRRADEDDPSSSLITMNMKCPLDRESHLKWTEDRLTNEMWANLSTPEANGGLGGGRGGGGLGPTKKLDQRMMANGQAQQA